MFKDRKAWAAYFGACLLAWLLYVLAGTEFQRGLWQLWEAVYQATLTLWPPMVLGTLLMYVLVAGVPVLREFARGRGR